VDYEFTQDWFSVHKILWEKTIEVLKPRKVLEIGSFEGRATTFIAEQAGEHNPVEIYCIDTWQGGVEHAGIDFDAVQARFDRNCELATQKAKNPVKIFKVVDISAIGMAKLMSSGITEFDLVYIDGSHIASDVFLDAAMGFYLTRVGGVIVFDDFTQSEKDNPYAYPKIAIQAFEDVHNNKLEFLTFRNDENPIPKDKFYQRYYWKIAP
jgi:predicted O-methyltransferase YrrM